MSTIASATAGRRQLKILIIRPDDRRPSEARESLVAAGHIVTEARGGEQAARILRNRPVNLVLVEGGHDALSLLEVAAGLRSESGRVSARYTPIFVLTDKPPLSPIWPGYIDGILSAPLDNETLVAAYLEFLSDSLSGVKRTTETMPCCEVEAAIDRLGGDVELYKDLVDRFLDDTAGIRQRLQAAIDTHDAAKLHSASHSLKGLAASVGAVRVAEALAELESLGRAGEFDGVAVAWQQFRIEMERTADELADYHRSSSVTPALRPNGA
jgi:HPt (histidine-containing phosphotransfer) domain-containing protein/CheY-like chemotaxis protein